MLNQHASNPSPSSKLIQTFSPLNLQRPGHGSLGDYDSVSIYQNSLCKDFDKVDNVYK